MKNWGKHIVKVIAIFLGALVLCASVAGGKSAKEVNPVGIWRADFESKLAKKPQWLVLYVERNQDGKYKAKFDFPQITAIGESIDSLDYQDGVLTFHFLGNASFSGKLDANGHKVVGRRCGNWWEALGGKTPLYDETDSPITFVHLEKAPEYKRPQVPHKPYPYIEEKITFKDRSGTVFTGVLTLPPGQGPFPALLFIPMGLGPDPPGPPFAGHDWGPVLSDAFARHGVAMLHLKTRSEQNTADGKKINRTDADLEQDTLAAMGYLKSRREINKNQIGLMGHSEGARVAGLAAVDSPDISFIILLAACGLTGGENICMQAAVRSRLNGEIEENISWNDKITRKILAGVLQHPNMEDPPLRKILKDSSYLEIDKIPKDDLEKLGGQKSFEDYANGMIDFFVSPWARQIAADDPRETLKRLKCPVLALCGEKDLQVLPQENLKAIREALEAGKNTDYLVQELPRLNHAFQTCKTGEWSENALIEETFSPEALNLIVNWVLEHTKNNSKNHQRF